MGGQKGSDFWTEKVESNKMRKELRILMDQAISEYDPEAPVSEVPHGSEAPEESEDQNELLTNLNDWLKRNPNFEDVGLKKYTNVKCEKAIQATTGAVTDALTGICEQESKKYYKD